MIAAAGRSAWDRGVRSPSDLTPDPSLALGETAAQGLHRTDSSTHMGSALGLDGKLFLKQDSELPISGSVKARGGIYEVLKFAEKIAFENNMLKEDDDYSILLNDEFKELFSKYTVSVGSTGNLGLSIGIMGVQLGFSVKVYMSSDARQWKRDLLRKKGAKVIETTGKYEMAVAEGRKEAENDPMCHFVDDENSEDLFLGYSVAGKRLAKQIEEMGIEISKTQPLCVYIPCGVGGAPGGITFGIKEYFGNNAHIYFAEPTLSPCMTLGLLTGEHNKIAVSYIGIRGKTIADGLAVGRPSKLVSEIMDKILDGAFTVKDDRLLPFVSQLMELENIFVEPSASAAFAGIPVIDAAMPQGAVHIASWRAPGAPGGRRGGGWWQIGRAHV